MAKFKKLIYNPIVVLSQSLIPILLIIFDILMCTFAPEMIFAEGIFTAIIIITYPVISLIWSIANLKHCEKTKTTGAITYISFFVSIMYIGVELYLLLLIYLMGNLSI